MNKSLPQIPKYGYWYNVDDRHRYDYKNGKHYLDGIEKKESIMWQYERTDAWLSDQGY